MANPTVLVDTNVMIEAVRTSIWNAVSGGTRLETVEECASEARRGDRFSEGYTVVSEEDLGRLDEVHGVTERQRAGFLLRLGDTELDDGERDLFAHAMGRDEPPPWVLTSPDRAAVRAAVGLGWKDRLISLEELAEKVGCPPARITRLRNHFTTRWLSSARTDALLEGLEGPL